VNNKSITAERLQEFGFEVPKIEAPAPEPAPAPAIHVPTVKEIMEAVLPHLPKPVKKAKPKRKPIDVNALFLKALEDIDIEVVLRKAQELYKSRGRV
jgi:hypothetical protein